MSVSESRVECRADLSSWSCLGCRPSLWVLTTSCPPGGGQLFDGHKLPSSPLLTRRFGSAPLHLIDTTQNGRGTLSYSSLSWCKVSFCEHTGELWTHTAFRNRLKRRREMRYTFGKAVDKISIFSCLEILFVPVYLDRK